MDEYQAFSQSLGSLVEGDRMTRAGALARRYWTEPFTGQFFHVLADDDHPNEITARDIAAVSTLGVTVPAPVTIWLLSGDGRSAVTDLLREIPPDVDIWNAGDLLNRDRELWALWNLLGSASWPRTNTANGMGRTKTSKLLAAKRPRLVPIYDSVLEQLLPRVANYWTAFEQSLRDSELRQRLADAADTGAHPGAALLRKLDAMLWMIGREESW